MDTAEKNTAKNVVIVPLAEYLRRQKMEMLGPYNKWLAGESLNKSPTDTEAALHYIDHGGAIDFANRFYPLEAIIAAVAECIAQGEATDFVFRYCALEFLEGGEEANGN
jgi:hypothetical protein